MKFLFLLVPLILLAVPLHFVSAQLPPPYPTPLPPPPPYITPPPSLPPGVDTGIPARAPLALQSVSGFIGWLRTVMGWAFTIVGIIAVIVILYSAALFMYSGDEKREKAKLYLRYGIIGIVVATIAGSIIAIIFNIFSGA